MGLRVAGKPFRPGEFFKKIRRFCNLCGSLALYLKDQNKNGEEFRIINGEQDGKNAQIINISMDVP
jgi:hypothetical protein